MPWDKDNPPDVAKNWTDEEQEKCIAAANGVLEDGGDDEQAIQACIHAAGKGESEKHADPQALRHVRLIDSAEGLRVGGYGVLWGNDKVRDVYETWFTPKTDFWDGKITPQPLVLYDHGFDEDLGPAVLGHVVAQRDDEKGRWIEAQLEAHEAYKERVLPLLEKQALSWSSGAVSHLSKVARSGEIESWATVEYSLTPMPAEPRMLLNEAQLQALSKTAPMVRSWLPKAAGEAAPETAEADSPAAEILSDPAVEDTAESHKRTVTEVTDMEAQEIKSLIEDSVNEALGPAVGFAVQEAIKAMKEATPPDKTGDKVGINDLPPEGSGVKSLGNFLLCVHKNNVKRLTEVYGSTKAALAEESGATGGYLVPDEYIPEVLSVAAETAVVRPRAYKQPMEGRSLQIPYLSQSSQPSSGETNFFGGVSFVWTEEAGTKTETEPTFKMMTLTAHELSGYTLASNQLLAHSAVGLEALLKRLFGQAIGWTEDYEFFNGNGVGKPLGIFNSPALIGVTRSTDAHFSFADVGSMLSRFLPTSWGKGVWVMHPTVIPDLMDMRNTGNYPMWVLNIQGALGTSLMGMPIVFSEKVGTLASDHSVLLADFSYYVIGQSGGLAIDSSIHYKFVNNQTTWRVTEMIDGQPWLDGPIYLQNASTTVSPFVALEDHT